MDSSGWVLIIILAVALLLAVYWMPTFIAFQRQHEYRWIIFVLNLVLGTTGIGWLVACVWAMWPANKSLADPLLTNPTGVGRNVGDTLREVRESELSLGDREIHLAQSRQALEALDKLVDLRDKGVLTSEEFDRKRAELLAGV